MQGMLKLHLESVDLFIKEKASKSRLLRDYSFLLDLIRGIELQLDGVLNGYDVMIMQKIQHKAEMSDIQVLDKSKADVSAV